MSNLKGCFSHDSDEWSTPDDFFKFLDGYFHFTLDACASFENAKCERFFSKDFSGLDKDWSDNVVFCNPPYSDISRWVYKCYHECLIHQVVVVLLIPSRTDTKYFHNWIEDFADIHFIKGRLKFGNSKNSAPFPSMLCIYYPYKNFSLNQWNYKNYS